MATCRVCSATLTSNPAEVNGSYGEDGSGKTLLESQVSKALGENLCTHHWMQVLEGNDNTAIASVTDNSMADALHRHSELSASDGTPDQSLIVAADGHITFVGKAHADATPIGLDVLRSAVVGINLDVGQNITVDGTVDGRDLSVDGSKLDTIATNADVATKEFFVPVTYGTTIAAPNRFPTAIITNASDLAAIGFYVPNDFSSITSVVIVRTAKATATHRLNYSSSYGRVTEGINTHAEELLDQDTAETNNTIYEQDISGILSVLTVGDYVGITITGDATNVPDDDIMGVRFKYS